jgi:hypothetical protein
MGGKSVNTYGTGGTPVRTKGVAAGRLGYVCRSLHGVFDVHTLGASEDQYARVTTAC